MTNLPRRGAGGKLPRAERFRTVQLAGRRWYLFHDSLIHAADCVRIWTLDARGTVGHDSAVIEALDAYAGDGRKGYWIRPYLLPSETPDLDPAEVLGFRVHAGPDGPRLSFADGGETPVRGVVEIRRADDQVEVWRPPFFAPQLFRPRPYPWAR